MMMHCCCGCEIKTDNFDRASIGTGWDQRSGSWSISSNKLATTDTGALIKCLKPLTSDAGTVRADITFPATGDIARLIAGYTDDDNYIFLEMTALADTSLLCKLGRRVAGVETLSTSKGAYAGGIPGTAAEVILCWTGLSANFDPDADERGISMYAPTTGRYAGLATGSTNSGITFDNFVITKHHNDLAKCFECQNCEEACSDGFPSTIEVTLPTGWSSSAATKRCNTHCTDFSGATYVLDRTADSTGCRYSYSASSFCVLTPGLFTVADLTITASDAILADGDGEFTLHQMTVTVTLTERGSFPVNSSTWVWRTGTMPIRSVCSGADWTATYQSALSGGDFCIAGTGDVGVAL